MPEISGICAKFSPSVSAGDIKEMGTPSNADPLPPINVFDEETSRRLAGQATNGDV